MTEYEPEAAPSGGQPQQWVAEARGASVDEAVMTALAQLGVERADAVVEVISAGSAPLPGERMSSAEAHVRVRRLDERTSRGRRLLAELLERMGISATVIVRAARSAGSDDPPPAILDVSGDDLGVLIGWRGETLRAIQTVLNLMMGEEPEDGRRLILDIERYRARREDQVRELARRMADRVRRTGERHMLDPMQGYERRAVHLALHGEPGVRTESVGHEPSRRVVIHPSPPGGSAG